MYKLYSALVLLVGAQVALSQLRGELQDETPKPFTYTYTTNDEYGNQVTRTETGDGSGTVRGSYSYSNQEGVFRVVEYVADATGVHYAIRTNEPGTGKHQNGDPADVAVEAEAPPQAVVDKYLAPQRSPAGAPARGRNLSILRRR